MSLFFALITATFCGMCIYALVRARRALAEDLRVRAIAEAVTPSTIRDAPAAGRLLLTGRATGSGGAVVTAPFSGQEAIWARSSAQTNIGQVIDSWTTQVDEIVLDDGSGRVAKVRLAGANVRLQEQSITGSEAQQRIAEFFESIGRSPGSSEFYWEAVLPPDSSVTVLATAVGAGSSYRQSAAAVSLSADAGELLVFEPWAHHEDPVRHRHYIKMATFGTILFGIATILLALAGLRA